MKTVDYTKLFKPKHFNKWVAINEEKSKILAFGDSPIEVLKKINNTKEKNPILTIALKSYYGFIT